VKRTGCRHCINLLHGTHVLLQGHFWCVPEFWGINLECNILWLYRV